MRKKKHEVSWTLDGRTLHFFNFHENKVTSEFFVHTRKRCNNTCSRVGLLEWKDYNYRYMLLLIKHWNKLSKWSKSDFLFHLQTSGNRHKDKPEILIHYTMSTPLSNKHRIFPSSIFRTMRHFINFLPFCEIEDML